MTQSITRRLISRFLPLWLAALVPGGAYGQVLPLPRAAAAEQKPPQEGYRLPEDLAGALLPVLNSGVLTPLRKTAQETEETAPVDPLGPVEASDPFEPNETPEEAAALVLGEAVEAALASEADTDYFVFEADAGLWAVELDGPAEAGLELALIGEDGGVLQEGGTWLVVPLSAAGRYWLRVSGAGAYRLGVRPLSATAIVTPGGSVSDALAAAAAGDTIVVLGGTYPEEIHLVEGVALVGAGVSTTLLAGGVIAEGLGAGLLRGFSLSRTDDTVLRLASSTVEIADCLVGAGGGSGVFAYGGGTSVVRRTRIEGNAAHGVGVFDDASLGLVGSQVQRNGEVGVWCVQGGSGRVQGGRVAGNGQAGIRVEGVEAEVVDVDVEDNLSTGLFVLGGGTVQVAGGRFAGNAFSGITVSGVGSTAEVREAALELNGNSGLWAVGGGVAAVEGTSVQGNAFSGATVQDLGSSLTVDGGRVEGNDNSGLWAVGGGRLRVAAAAVANNTLSGVLVEGAGSLGDIEGATLTGNGQAGVRFLAGGVGSVQNSVLQGNLSLGISMQDPAQPPAGAAPEVALAGNRVFGNEVGGIWILSGARASLNDNAVTGNNGSGVGAAGEGVVVAVEGGRISGNASSGAGALLGAVLSISQAAVDSNQVHGLIASDAVLVASENRLRGNLQMGIAFNEGGTGSARTNTLEDNALSGILVNSPGVEVELVGNTVAGHAEQGIFVNGGLVLARDNVLTANAIGMAVQGAASEAVAVNNAIDANTQDGMALALAAVARFDSNRVGGSGRYGIRVEGGAAAGIRGNQVSGSGAIGVGVFDSSRVELAANTISGSVQSGVLLLGGVAPSVRGNTLRDNGQTGLLVRGGQVGEVAENLFSGNDEGGLWVDAGGACVALRGNRFLQNGGNGVFASDNASLGIIAANQVEGNSLNGVRLQEQARLDSLAGNEINGNEGFGFSAEESGVGPVRDNRFNGNLEAGAGFTALEGALELSGNTFADNGKVGFVLQTDSSLVEGNTVSGSGNIGVQASEGRSAFTGNTFADNGGTGLEVLGGRSRVADNDFRANGRGVAGGDSVHIDIVANRFIGDLASVADSGSVGLVEGNDFSGGRVVVSDGAEARVQDNSITDSGAWAVLITGGGDAEVRGNTITGAELSGVRLQSPGSRGIIVDNDIRDNDEVGVWNSAGAYAEVVENRISGNLEGVQFQSGATGLVRGNEISGMEVRGVLVLEGAEARVEDNRISQCRNGGIQIEDDSTRVELVGNEVFDNPTIGISVREGAFALVRGNRAAGNADDGLLVIDAGSRAEAEGNLFEENGGHGISVLAEASALVRDNDVNGNKRNGVYVEGEATVETNRLTGNTGSGLRGHAGAAVRADSNHALENGGSGFYASGAGTRLDLLGNEAARNSEFGARFTDGAAALAEGNTFLGNELSGLRLAGARLEARGNKVEDNFEAGIWVTDGGVLVAEDNDVAVNLFSGVGVSGAGSTAELTGNRVVSNRQIGLLVRDGGQAQARDNEFGGNVFEGVRWRDSGSGGVLQDNLILGNDGGGVLLLATDSAIEVADNDIADNADDGVVASDSRGFVLRDNTVRGNDGNGVVLRRSADFVLAGNRIETNGRWGIELEASALDPAAAATNRLQANHFNGVGIEEGARVPLAAGGGDSGEAFAVRQWTSFGVRQGVGALEISGDLGPSRLRGRRLLASGGFLWAATDDGISRFEPRAGVWQTFAVGAATDLLETASGVLWAASEAGPLRWDGAVGAWLGAGDGPAATDLLETASGVLWAATAAGPARWDGNGGWEVFDGGAVYQLVESGGVLWASAAAGALRWDGSAWNRRPAAGGGAFVQLAADADGLWGITAATLQRFDGEAWSVFAHADSLGMGALRALDHSGETIWLGSENGVSRWDGSGVWLTYAAAFDPASGDYEPLGGLVFYQTPAGRLWAGTAGGVAARFVADTGRWLAFEVGDHSVLGLVEDAEGQVWSAAEGVGVSRLDAATWSGFSEAAGLADPAVTRLVLSGTDEVWAATPIGPSRYESERGVWQASIDGLERFNGSSEGIAARDLVEDGAGDLWVGTDFGIARREGDGEWRFFDGDSVSVMLYDAEAGLWAATQTGLSLFDGAETWETIPYPEGANLLAQVLLAVDGAIWVGGEGGVERYAIGAAQWDTPPPPVGLEGQPVRALAAGPDGVWLGSEAGIWRWDGEEWRGWSEAEGLPSEEINALLAAGGEVWAGTDRGVALFEADGRWRTFGSDAGLNSTFVSFLKLTASGALWAGTNGGLSRFDRPARRWISFTREDGLLDNEVNDLAETAAGEVWVATQGGISRLISPGQTAPPVFSLESNDVVNGFAAAPFAAFEAQITDPATLDKRLLFTHALVEAGIAAPEPQWETAGDAARVVLSDLPDGDFSVFVWARDRFGNVARQQVNFTVDTAAPIALVTSPRPNDVISGRVPVRGTVVDLSGVPSGSRPDLSEYRLEVRQAGEEEWTPVVVDLQPEGVVEAELALWDVVDLSGAYELRLRAVDRLGHSAEAVVPLQVAAARGEVERDRQARLADSGGRIELVLPPGALAADTLVTLTRLLESERQQLPAAGKAAQEPLGEVYRIEPVGVPLAKPGVLRLAWDGEEAADPPGIFYLEEEEGRWTPVGGRLVSGVGGAALQAAVDRLGTFALFAREETAAFSGVRDFSCQPRMISPRGGGFAERLQVSFALGRAGPVSVEVYNAAGHLLRRLLEDRPLLPGSNVFTWDGRDADGRWVQEGPYIIRVEAGGSEKKKVVAVVNGQAPGQVIGVR